jgi:hypothetical protein
MPLELEKTIVPEVAVCVPAAAAIPPPPGAATDIVNPLELSVTEALLADVFVPAYPPAFRLMPLELTVHVTFVPAVLRPTASLDARAVVR